MLDWDDVTTWLVLVVDDEPDNLDLVEETLEYYGVTVKAVSSAAEGLSIMQQFAPNLILLDLSMPDMDGWEFHKQVRTNPPYSEIPVIAMTAHAMVGDKERALAAGFDGYITKPISVPSLITDIKTAYQEHKGNNDRE